MSLPPAQACQAMDELDGLTDNAVGSSSQTWQVWDGWVDNWRRDSWTEQSWKAKGWKDSELPPVTMVRIPERDIRNGSNCTSCGRAHGASGDSESPGWALWARYSLGASIPEGSEGTVKTVRQWWRTPVRSRQRLWSGVGRDVLFALAKRLLLVRQVRLPEWAQKNLRAWLAGDYNSSAMPWWRHCMG